MLKMRRMTLSTLNELTMFWKMNGFDDERGDNPKNRAMKAYTMRMTEMTTNVTIVVFKYGLNDVSITLFKGLFMLLYII